MTAWMVKACLCLPVCELEGGDNELEGGLWWPLKMTSDPMKRLEEDKNEDYK